MKKIFIYTIISILMGSFLSCNDVLDAQPKDKIPQEQFWKSKENVNSLITNLYDQTFPTVYEGNGAFEEAMSDNSYLVWEGWYTNIKLVGNGTQDSYGTVPFNIWNKSYTVIRGCWQFMENRELMKELSPEELLVYTGQIRFLMAYNYQRLVFFFGDVPLVQKVLTVPESREVPRSPKAEVTTFILEQLDLAAAELNGKKLAKGRATTDVCNILKARVYLQSNDFENLLDVTTGLIGKYALHTAGATPYADLFNGKAENANEIILSRQMAHSEGSIKTGHYYNQAFFLKGMSGGDALRAIAPTGSLVDAYPMLDGRLIHEQGSIYNPADPYTNRDPRLAQSIIYPTSQLRVVASGGVMKEVLYDPENSSTIALQQYDAKEPSPTGYMWTKYVDWSDHAMVQITDCGNDQILMRYADVLLMHAEALIEVKGLAGKTEVIGIINQLRDRVGGGNVHDANYSTKEDVRDLVRNERRIELANEGLRYYDIIRWKIAEKTNTTEGHGLKGEVYGAYMRLDGVGKTDRVVMIDGVARRYVETRNFRPEKHYLQPVPQKDRDLAKKGMLTQNPNW